jgi:ribonucleotide monophosphatase NagD (HAD superfamily)
METAASTPVTEKVFHALLALHPVIIVGNPGVVEYLRTQGFDMFDDFIDHSYDSVMDTNTRIDKLFTDNIDLIAKGFDRQLVYQRLCANRDQVWAYYRNQLNNFETNLVKNLKNV